MKNKIITITIMIFSLFQLQGFGQVNTVAKCVECKKIWPAIMMFETIGDWRVSETFFDNVQIKGMVGPEITFYENFRASIQNCTKEMEYYTWRIKSDTLYLEYDGEPHMEHYFTAPTYKMVFKDHETYLELKLYTTKTSGYILHKNKKYFLNPRYPRSNFLIISHATPIGVVDSRVGSFVRKLRKLAYGYSHETPSG